ncbi:MAG: ribosomal biogenesis protein [Methanomassiliicoccus sp.]|nr:ribosomal biogenesis protein [Methanomassiliicoccus sp.]
MNRQGVPVRMILVTKWFGVFLVDKEKQKVIRHTLFEKDPKAIATKLALVQKGEVLPEEAAMAQKRMRVAEPRLSPLGKPEFVDSAFIRPEDYGFSPQLMQKVMVELGKLRTREPLPADRFIVQAVRALDDTIEMINLTSERLHEWYGLHFPELADYAREERYARLIAEKGSREVIQDALDLQLESVGSELEEKDLEVVRGFANSLIQLYEEKARLEAYIAERMEEAAPNITSIVGASLGARLISIAGGLKRLSRMPAGTVQLLGAEKALFAHLRQGKRPPKHGVIFQHPTVHRAPYWQRGNISRTMGGKLAIASKVDYFKGEFIGDRLNEDIAKRVEEVMRKYPEPPKKEQRPRTDYRPKGQYHGPPRQGRPQQRWAGKKGGR